MTDKTTLSDEQAVEIVKKKRGAKWMKDLSADGGSCEPGEMSRFVRNALVSWNLPPIDISDPAQVEKRIGEYFQHCIDNDRRPQVVGMCNWLGITRATLNLWQNGEYRSSTHLDIIKKAMSILEESWADLMMSNKLNPGAGCFIGKNWYSYSDTQQIVLTPNNPLQNLDEEAARKRIIEALPEPDETD